MSLLTPYARIGNESSLAVYLLFCTSVLAVTLQRILGRIDRSLYLVELMYHRPECLDKKLFIYKLTFTFYSSYSTFEEVRQSASVVGEVTVDSDIVWSTFFQGSEIDQNWGIDVFRLAISKGLTSYWRLEISRVKSIWSCLSSIRRAWISCSDRVILRNFFLILQSCLITTRRVSEDRVRFEFFERRKDEIESRWNSK